MMNILITTFSFPSLKNGIYDGKFVLAEAMAYADNGANVRVITPHYAGAKKKEKIHDRVTVYRFQYFFPTSRQVLKQAGTPMYNQRRFTAFAQLPFFFLIFIASVLKHAIWADIIHAQWTVSALLALPAKWLLGKKIVLTARGSDLRLVPEWLNRFIHYQVDGAIDCFGPQAWNNEYKKKFSANFVSLPLAVYDDASCSVPEDMKRHLSRKSDPFVILYVGRFDKIKLKDNKLPLLDLIHSSKALREKKMNFQVFYVGDGDSKITEEMLRLIDVYGLHSDVTLLGPKTNVLDYVRFCHLGVGGVAFNAVSQEFTICGKPQILVEGGDNADTPWRHRVNSIMIKPCNKEDLGVKLAWAICNRKKSKGIGEEAKREMSKFVMGCQSAGRLYLEAFRNLITGI